MLCLHLGLVHATTPVTPIAIEISGSVDSFQYIVDKKPMEISQILPYLKTICANFGLHMPCDIWITDTVPMSSVIKMSAIIKESGLVSEPDIYLISPREEGRGVRGDVVINKRALHKISISPFPVYPADTVPRDSTPTLSKPR